jgi:HPt (histidine-containing phosphotransfer) domain-containing protein
MDAALAAGDATGFGDAAHALKGSAAALGAVRLRTAAFELELRGRDNNLENAQELVNALEAVLSEAIDALSREDARSRQESIA